MTEDRISSSNFAETALQFINSTSGHIFLTGKAGTGKTTFLKNLAAYTYKQFVVVAPTGIAALNAGGVTIHSQFLLPLGTFLPDQEIFEGVNAGEGFYTQKSLAGRHPLNSVRKQVLRSIDLLVIDEVSILRADVLDAIDYRLKAARGNSRRSFGGVQLLLIGDLYQLPPVVRRNEENLLSRYYDSIWFYDSLALKQEGIVYIELDKIFRQVEDRFISILNNLRDNTPTMEDIDTLNKYFMPEKELKALKEVITLTTHNNKADALNVESLRSLESASHFFEAQIEGEFPESMYPVQAVLELKVGAQIMFIRNDSEGKMYFNGKLATVSEISGDSIAVTPAESHVPLELKRERWENKKYTINDKTKDIEDEVIGTFSQYPVKPAWAITVHKSQGLTFDKAVIDVSRAFAAGQVYVALSRLRSLDGLILRAKIDFKGISTDSQIAAFTQHHNQPDQLPQVMRDRRIEFIRIEIERIFDFLPLIKQIGYANRSGNKSVTMMEESMKPVLTQITNALEAERVNTIKFRKQLLSLLQNQEYRQLTDRMNKGSEYYKNLLTEKAKLLLAHKHEMQQRKRVKTYLSNLNEMDQLITKRLEDLHKTRYLIEGILAGKLDFDFSHLKEKQIAERNILISDLEKQFPGSKKKVKRTKIKHGTIDQGPNTYDITLEMWQQGMNIEEIAKERELVPSTIEGHLAKAVQGNKIDIFKFIAEEDVNLISKAIIELPEEYSSKDLFIKLDGKYSYGKLRAVINFVKDKK